ncbi:MAG: hypothetical protein H0T54_08315 [Geodermatophilaceae bacterium]|nr:hypothetical protein [Geodermatophilaceae bacterium]
MSASGAVVGLAYLATMLEIGRRLSAEPGDDARFPTPYRMRSMTAEGETVSYGSPA